MRNMKRDAIARGRRNSTDAVALTSPIFVYEALIFSSVAEPSEGSREAEIALYAHMSLPATTVSLKGERVLIVTFFFKTRAFPSTLFYLSGRKQLRRVSIRLSVSLRAGRLASGIPEALISLIKVPRPGSVKAGQ